MLRAIEVKAGSPRALQAFPPGSSTAAPFNLAYRLGKIRDLGCLHGTWLDFGCADGFYTTGLTRYGASSAIGVDVIGDRVAEARLKQAGQRNVEFHLVASSSLPFQDATFDGVLLNEVLEHVYSEDDVLKELLRVLRPGGSLIIMSPNRWFPFEGHGGHIGSLQLRWPVPFLPWLPGRIGQRFMHARNYWPHELRELVRKHGFAITAVDFVWPVFEIHPWLPAAVVRRYQKIIPFLERLPGIRRFGVSVFVAARKPDVL